MRSAIFMTCLLGILTLTACKEEEHHKENTVFSVTKPWRQDVQINLEYVAQIKAIQHIEVRAFEKGYLQNIYVDEGQMVPKGTKMFQLMPMLMQAEYDKAKAEFDVSTIEYNQTKRLAQQKVVSQNELALTKAKYEKSKAVLDLAKAHLDLTSINAPFDGIMDRFRVRLGSLVEEGELLTTLSDITKLWVYFNVSERDYLNYMNMKKDAGKGDAVKLRMANGQFFDQPGIIDTIEADFDSETGNVAFRATFENPKQILRHGETGNAILTQELKNVLVVPQKAVFDVLDKHFAYVIDPKGKVIQKELFIDYEVPHLFIIKSGLTEEDTILLEGLGKISTGMEIKTKFEDTSAVKKSFELEAH
ncbi:MAG: efflux RND transporter periplasmic adaptor subunit [Bacteriovoracaceae bacterium]|nr:efflux RND transporter periplasmic adaptor subunit [Bacteriovoracaceae bacterium]